MMGSKIFDSPWNLRWKMKYNMESWDMILMTNSPMLQHWRVIPSITARIIVMLLDLENHKFFVVDASWSIELQASQPTGERKRQ